ncbi:growth-regulated alpha protein-like [Mustelus asterias]
MNTRLQITAPITTFFLLQHLFVNELETAALPLRCQCFQFVDKVHPKIIKSFQILPKSAHCSRTEIILTVQQNNKEVCLQPEEKQGKKLQNCWESIRHDPNRMRQCTKGKPKKSPNQSKKRGRKGRNTRPKRQQP